MDSSKVLAIIPARYASTRFPGKPLAMIGDMTMIEHVWRGVSRVSAIGEVVVATDDERIADEAESFGAFALITRADHKSGTDRCGEVLRRLDADCEVVINVQGDEPRVQASQLESLIEVFEQDPSAQIATLRKRITRKDELGNPNVVKVAVDSDGNALDFSRQPISNYKHVGIYAFRPEVLMQLVELPQSEREISNRLEQLRWLDNGYRIAVRDTKVDNIGIDTPEDLEKLLTKNV